MAIISKLLKITVKGKSKTECNQVFKMIRSIVDIEIEEYTTTNRVGDFLVIRKVTRGGVR